MKYFSTTCILFLLILTACAAPLGPVLPGEEEAPVEEAGLPQVDPASIVPAFVESTPLTKTDGACSGGFIAHQLDHITAVPGGEDVRMFEANGGGVAINDLDNDGDLDILLANHAGPNTLLWNEGELEFRLKRFPEGDSRAANIVDIDGDGRLDILFTRRASAPNYWRNEDSQHFAPAVLPGVDKPLYAINWGDLDGDDDLDFVGGTYDAGLLTEFGTDFLASGSAGVYFYENQDGKYQASRLADNAQAMALILPDLNDDGRPDIMVGNDFAVPDYAWLRVDDGWEAAPFETISHSTMSLAQGDVNNDGSYEIFSTDMMPYSHDPQTEAAWAPVMQAMMDDPHLEGDPQIMANVLQMHLPGLGYSDTAGPRGVDATGWSWSSKFGDLDQDGLLDLYVVNGFMEYTTFGHLPNHELVEENQVLRNNGNGYFTPAPEWGLGSTSSGRGMSMADLDGDGDLDIVVNNLRAPAQLFENQLCSGDSLQADLFWPYSGNTRALGAELTLHTNQGTFYRTIDAGSGYLSGDPARVHFGLPGGSELQRLDIRWPDGRMTSVEDPQPGTLLSITRE